MNVETKQQIHVLIIEDEAHNSRMLRDLTVKLRPSWIIDTILESVEDSVLWLKNKPAPDLVLLDIQLSDGTCFSIFKRVEIDVSSRIIFTTAYDEYAIRAFKVNSIDYLLKPINEGELELAFEKFEHLRANDLHVANDVPEDRAYYKNIIDSILEGRKEYRTRFLISGIQGYQKIETKEIAYIYSNNKLTFAVDFNKMEYTLDYNLEQLESELEPSRFFRASRKIIVNIDAIVKVSNDLGGKLKIDTVPPTDFEISVSRLKSTEFKIWLGK